MDNPIITNAATESDNTQDDKFAREFTAFNIFDCPECKFTIKTSPDPRFYGDNLPCFRIVLEQCYVDILSSIVSCACNDMMLFVDFYGRYEEAIDPDEITWKVDLCREWMASEPNKIVVSDDLKRLNMDKNYVQTRSIVCNRTCFATALVMSQLQSRMQDIAKKLDAYITERYPAYKFGIQTDFSRTDRMLLNVKCAESPIEVYNDDTLKIDSAVQRVFDDIRNYVEGDFCSLKSAYERIKPEMEDEPKPINFSLNVYSTPETKIIPITKDKIADICREYKDLEGEWEVYPAHNLTGNWLWVDKSASGLTCLLTPDGIKKASCDIYKMECVIDGCRYKIDTSMYHISMGLNLNCLYAKMFVENKILEQQKGIDEKNRK
jgi:hypothetical protein